MFSHVDLPMGPLHNRGSATLRECDAYIGQLRRVHGSEPEGVLLARSTEVVRGLPVATVACFFEENDPVARRYAAKCFDCPPQGWDTIALQEL